MSSKRSSKPARVRESSAPARPAQPPQPPGPAVPFGTETPRRSWVLVLWIVLCAAWLVFLVVLVLRQPGLS